MEWTIRVAQEFVVDVEDANEAHALANKLHMRKVRGARLVDGGSYLAPTAIVGETRHVKITRREAALPAGAPAEGQT